MSVVSYSAPQKYRNVGLVEVMKNRMVTTKKVRSLNKSEFSASETVKIRCTDDGYVDWSTARFQWKYTGYLAGAGTFRVTPNAESAIKILKIESENATIIEQFQDRDVLANAMLRHTAGADAMRSERGVMANVNLSPTLGDYKGVEVTLGGAGDASIPVSTMFNMGWMSSAGLVPMKYMGQLTFEIELNSQNVLYESVSPVTNFKLSEFELVYDSYSFGPEFDAFIIEKINSPDGLNIKYDTFTGHVDNTSATDTTSKLSLASSSLKGIYTTLRQQDTVGNAVVAATVNMGGHNYRFAAAGLIDYQYNVVGKVYPSFKADFNKHAYSELLKSLNRWSDLSTGSLVSYLNADKTYRTYNAGLIIVANNETGSMLVGQSFEEHGDPYLRSGVNTMGSLDVEFNFRRSVGTPLIINSFSHTDKIMKIMPGNQIQIIH